MGPVPDHIELRRNSFGVGATGSHDLLLTSAIPKAGNWAAGAIAVEGSSDIAIAENTFYNPVAPAIDVVVGARIDISNNKIVSDAFVSSVPGPAVRLSAGAGFSVNGLSVGPASGITAAVEIDCGVRAIDPSRWSIQSGAIPRLLDRRPQCQSPNSGDRCLRLSQRQRGRHRQGFGRVRRLPGRLPPPRRAHPVATVRGQQSPGRVLARGKGQARRARHRDCVRAHSAEPAGKRAHLRSHQRRAEFLGRA